MAYGKEILASLAIRFGIDTSEMGAGVEKAKSKLSGLSSSIKGLGVALVASTAFIKLNQWAKEGYEGYRKQLEAEKLLLTALKGRKDIQERLVRQAEYLQETTLFEDDQIINSQKMLAAIGMSERQIRDVISAATQLSTALGVDLDAAVKMLTGSYSGNLRQLGKYVPELKNLTKEQLKAGKAVEWVNENMKGLAETAANTDPIIQMAKEVRKLKESFGELIAPAVTKFATRGQKQFAILQSDQFTFWQKLSAGLFSKKRTDELYDQYLALQALQQKTDEAAASTESFTSAIEEEGEALRASEIKENLEGMAKAMEKVSRASMSVPDFWGNQPQLSQMTGKSIGFVNSEAQQNDPFASWRSMRELVVKNNQEMYLQMIEDTKNFTQIIEAMVEDMVINIAESFGDIIASGKNANWNQMLVPIANAMSMLGKLIITEAIAIQALKDNLKNWASTHPGVAIAAGMALIAIASSIKAGISNIASGGSSGATMPNASNSSSDQIMYRKMGDAEPIRVEVTGTLRGDMIRLANKRAENRHNSGY